MTTWFVLGTAAELIKMYPVILEADRRGYQWFAISSGQSPVNLLKQWHDLKLPENKIFAAVDTTQDLSSPISALKWFFSSVFMPTDRLANIIKKRSSLDLSPKDLVFVHGDTLTTLLGSIWAKKLRLQIAHVEAGMRSGNLLEPFPEEICRRIVSYLANWHFPPYEQAAQNLINEKQSGKIVSTGANTLLDAIKVVLEKFPRPADSVSGKVIVNLHRFENLNNEVRWNKMMDVLRSAVKKYKLVFVMHPPTRYKLEKNQVLFDELKSIGIEFRDRVPFTQFAHWLKDCDFLITDGGSNQQETSYLGKPCLLLRDRTESIEGLQGNCVLSRFNDTLIQNFLADPEKYRTQPLVNTLQPTQAIFESLEAK